MFYYNSRMDVKQLESKLYWIWLSLLFGYGSDKPNQILMQYETPEEFYNCSAQDMFKLGFLTEKDVKTIKTVSLARAQKIIDDCEKLKIDIVTMSDKLYPNRLKNIYGPPVVLYVKGDISGIDDEVVITVVGTRKATEYSSYTTEYLSYHIAQAGAIVVSGCAVGIDTAAHRGAIRAKGRTIAVLGCGLDINYPAENKALKEMILKKGALISELPPGEGVTGRIFPVRNRIMAALSLGVLITHAPERSGSLITAEHGIEQGKDIFCVPPYSIFDTQFSGVIKYIRDGAIPVFCAKDILIEYYGSHAHKLDVDKIIGDYINQKRIENRPERVKRATPVKAEPTYEKESSINEQKLDEFRESNREIISSFDENQLLVYNKLNLVPKFIDELSTECSMNVGTVLSVLTELEIMGVASSFSGRRYALTI